ncbi:hypothetical protein DL96DRAFT_1684760 [Flagelloscypha sp. PMI_526]|nr:hypothetical protein DL96DRAFT_1684760 [Flagelloscypha sp. PMI_526]
MPILKLLPPKRPIDKINLDVLSEIFHFVHDTSRPDIFTLLRVSDRFYNVALPFTVRECSLEFEGNAIQLSHARINRWLGRNSQEAWVLSSIRHFIVFGTPYVDRPRSDPKEVPREEKWAPVIRLLLSLPNLVHFTFACPLERVPADLHKALEENHPRAVLSIKNWTAGRGRDRFADKIVIDAEDEALAASPLLRNIQMNHSSPEEWDVSYFVLKWIISRSPQLESVNVISLPKKWGHSGRSMNVKEIKRRLAAVFAPSPILPKHKLRQLQLFPCEDDFSDFCIRVAEPSSLEELHCGFPLPTLVLPETSHQLTRLRCLKVKIVGWERATDVSLQLAEFLSACGLLETLSIHSFFPLQLVQSAIMDHHGPSLLSLTLLHYPKYSSNGPIIPASVGDIALIRKRCPRLQELALTAVRDKPISDISNALGMFTSLSSITLVFPDAECIGSFQSVFSLAFDEEVTLEGDDVSEGERALVLQLPVGSDFPIRIWDDIYGKGCRLSKLTVKLGSMFLRKSAQEFVMNLGVDGKMDIENRGYALEDDEDVSWKLNPAMPRVDRLRRLWMALLPGCYMHDKLKQQNSTPRPF